MGVCLNLKKPLREDTLLCTSLSKRMLRVAHCVLHFMKNSLCETSPGVLEESTEQRKPSFSTC